VSTIHPPLPQFRTRVLPVIVITKVAQAVPLAHALLEGGIDAMEITLRHEAGLPAIEEVAKAVPEMLVGAGTVTQPSEVDQVVQAGAKFGLSPGFTLELARAIDRSSLPFVPGAMTPSEVLNARDMGYSLIKLFPASLAGGHEMLKALSGPISGVKFCPTGGITIKNMTEYLNLPNVAIVGGSWLTPQELLEARDWDAITKLARQATERAI
jgi:2-dehydro-3-deoxyphosphogluconate aldolase/(4S)-4-hydroxy-2-oxoglutarate aldolase